MMNCITARSKTTPGHHGERSMAPGRPPAELGCQIGMGVGVPISQPLKVPKHHPLGLLGAGEFFSMVSRTSGVI